MPNLTTCSFQWHADLRGLFEIKRKSVEVLGVLSVLVPLCLCGDEVWCVRSYEILSERIRMNPLHQRHPRAMKRFLT